MSENKDELEAQDSENLQKIKVLARKVSFLMQHQHILPDLQHMLDEIYPLGIDTNKIDRESPEYLLGAYEALANLIMDLEEKGD
jgi:hypothetical protein